MAAKGGSPKEATIKGRPFACAGDSPENRKLGGKSNKIERNGDSWIRVIQTEEGWQVTLKLSINDDTNDLEFLQDLCDEGEPFAFGYTTVGGLEYGNEDAQIEGAVERSGESATADVTFKGAGRLGRQ